MADQRATDADRELAIEQLRRAGGDGRLTLEELDERLGLAHEARTRSTLAELLADVAGGSGIAAAPSTDESQLVVRPGQGGSRLLLSVFGTTQRSGRWRVAPRCTVLSVLGSASLDLNDAELAADDVTITVISLLGSADVRVPEELRVEVSDVGIMGGNDVRRGRPGVERLDGPVVRLRLFSIMGGATLRRGRRRSRQERRLDRADHREPMPPGPPAPPTLP
jgi:Domain of unknown function (DUF1707)